MYLAPINVNRWTEDVIPLMTADFIKRYPAFQEVSLTIRDDKNHTIKDEPIMIPTYTDGVKIYLKGKIPGMPSSAIIEPASIGNVSLTKLDTNCGVGIISNLSTVVKRKKIGTWLMAWSLHILAYRGFTIAIGTTNPHMSAMENLLVKCKWKEITEMNFLNKRSANQIKFWRTFLTRTNLGQNIPHLT